jgi:tetratricopeptide (TPR) repeat protein
VRRYLVAALVLAATAIVGAGVYTAYATDREYSRLIASGDQAAADEHLFQALEAYSGAIALRPDSMLAHLKRGMTYRRRGELDAALKDLRRAAQLDPTATMPLELLGDTNLALQRYDRAAERYETYLSLDDRSARVWYKLGLARYRAGQRSVATAPLQRAAALDQSMAEAHFLLGLCYRDEGRTGLARQALETATELAPGLTAPREALAGVYASSGETARAIDQLEALAALEQGRPDRFVALGLAHARARRYDAAVLTLSRTVERFPNEPKVYAALGRVWLDAAEARDDEVALKKAIQALATAASHSDVTSETLRDLGRAWLLYGDARAAERALREAVAIVPTPPDAYMYLANLEGRAGRIQPARDALIRYATLIGDHEPLAGVATQIASYSIRLGEPDLAIRWIDRAVDDAGPTASLSELRRRAEALR